MPDSSAAMTQIESAQPCFARYGFHALLSFPAAGFSMPSELINRAFVRGEPQKNKLS